MKYFAALLLLVAVVSSILTQFVTHLLNFFTNNQVYADDEWTVKTLPDLIAARTACVTKHDVPAEALEKYKAWNFPDDDATKTYVTCIFKEFGLFCDHEGFHIDRLTAQFKTAHGLDIQTVVEKCAEKTDADTTNEKWVFRAFKCFTAEHLPLVRAQLTKST